MRKFTKPVEVDLAREDAERLPVRRARHGRADPRPVGRVLRLRGADRMVVGEHTFFVGEVVDAGFLKDEDTPVLRMEDTRMNYGG